jgi:thioredoxin 1
MLEITDAEFEKEVLKSNKPVVVDFFASWCAPCQALMPRMQEFSAKYTNVKIVKMNVENNPQTPPKFSVMSIPTIIFFDKGKVVGQITGADANGIEAKIKEL